MRRRTTHSSVLVGLLVVFAAGVTRAGEPEAKAPSAAKVLQDTYENFLKAESYRARLSVVGGVTESKQHRVTNAIVDDTYTGAVYGRVMAVAQPRSFRTQTAGAIRKAGQWKSLVATQDGARMHRLFVWPQQVLERALKYKDGAEWVERAKKSREREQSARPSDRESATSTKTKVAERGESEASSFPGRIRVEAPTREALKHIIEVENSGCLSGG